MFGYRFDSDRALNQNMIFWLTNRYGRLLSFFGKEKENNICARANWGPHRNWSFFIQPNQSGHNYSFIRELHWLSKCTNLRQTLQREIHFCLAAIWCCISFKASIYFIILFFCFVGISCINCLGVKLHCCIYCLHMYSISFSFFAECTTLTYWLADIYLVHLGKY